MRYPMISNWITYEPIDIRKKQHIICNHVLDENRVVDTEDILFARCLDGKTDPARLLEGYTDIEIRNYLIYLEAIGLIRVSKNVISSFPIFMRTLLIVNDNLKFRRIASYINILLMCSFAPLFVAGALRCLSNNICLSELGDYYMLGHWIGLVMGVALHEIGHAIAATAYNVKVMEFGIMFNVYPAAYTLIDNNTKQTRMHKIQIALAGIEMNFLLAGVALNICAYRLGPEWQYSGLFFGIAIVNILMGIINMLLIDGVDGMHVMELVIGNEHLLADATKVVIDRLAKRELLNERDGKIKICAASIFTITRLIYPALLMLSIGSLLIR